MGSRGVVQRPGVQQADAAHDSVYPGCWTGGVERDAGPDSRLYGGENLPSYELLAGYPVEMYIGYIYTSEHTEALSEIFCVVFIPFQYCWLVSFVDTPSFVLFFLFRHFSLPVI